MSSNPTHAKLDGSLPASAVAPAAGKSHLEGMLEELRVSLWAQQLKTPMPISFKRLERSWSELR